MEHTQLRRTASTEQRVRAVVADACEYQNRCCWLSVQHIAKRAECSERSVQYALRRLCKTDLDDLGHTLPCGKIVRSRVYRFKPGIKRLCTQDTSYRSTKRPSPPRTSCFARSSLRCAPERRPMSNLPDRIERQNGDLTPFNAGDLIKALADEMAIAGIALPGEWRARIGKSAKDLLSSGVNPGTVLRAAILAVRRREPHLVTHIAMDIQLVESGQALNRRQYQQALLAHQIELSPEMAKVEALMREAMRP